MLSKLSLRSVVALRPMMMRTGLRVAAPLRLSTLSRALSTSAVRLCAARSPLGSRADGLIRPRLLLFILADPCAACSDLLQGKGKVRVEKDTFGPIEVPADKYWGAQTQR